MSGTALKSSEPRQPRVSFWLHPTHKSPHVWDVPRYSYGFSLVVFKRGVSIGTRGIGLFSWARRPVLWPRDRKVSW